MLEQPVPTVLSHMKGIHTDTFMKNCSPWEGVVLKSPV